MPPPAPAGKTFGRSEATEAPSPSTLTRTAPAHPPQCPVFSDRGLNVRHKRLGGYNSTGYKISLSMRPSTLSVKTPLRARKQSAFQLRNVFFNNFLNCSSRLLRYQHYASPGSHSVVWEPPSPPVRVTELRPGSAAPCAVRPRVSAATVSCRRLPPTSQVLRESSPCRTVSPRCGAFSFNGLSFLWYKGAWYLLPRASFPQICGFCL